MSLLKSKCIGFKWHSTHIKSMCEEEERKSFDTWMTFWKISIWKWKNWVTFFSSIFFGLWLSKWKWIPFRLFRIFIRLVCILYWAGWSCLLAEKIFYMTLTLKIDNLTWKTAGFNLKIYISCLNNFLFFKIIKFSDYNIKIWITSLKI